MDTPDTVEPKPIFVNNRRDVNVAADLFDEHDNLIATVQLLPGLNVVDHRTRRVAFAAD